MKSDREREIIPFTLASTEHWINYS